MKAEYCVDYLSHQWNTDDLITTYQETSKQRQKNVVNHNSTLTKNEKKLKKSEEYKIKRFQNALWRSMAKNCTNKLSKSNRLINPATVSWQKESDITWLYGPMYSNSNSVNKSKIDATQQSSLQGLKPVLKKQSNVTQLIPSCSDPNLAYYSIDSTTNYTYTYHTTTTTTVWSDYTSSSSVTTSGICSSRSSFSSVSSGKSTNSIGVHFNPEIIEIEYQPEYPVSLESSPLSCPPNSSTEPYNYYYNNNSDYESYEDEDEDDVLWSLLVQASNSLKSSTYTRISTLFSNCLFLYNAHQQQQQHKKHSLSSSLPTRYHPHHIVSNNTNSINSNSIHLFLLLVSMMKSVFSLTTTWLLYQSLSPLSSWLSVTTSASSKSVVKSSFASAAAAAAAGQSSTTNTKHQSKKARLPIIL